MRPVLRRLREDPRWRDLPVVLFTGIMDGPLIEEAGRLGILDCILKGRVAGTDLLDRIGNYLPAH